MDIDELKERLHLEVAIMSYIINEQPESIPVKADDFYFEIIKDIYTWWTEYDYVPTRTISLEESEIIDSCINADNASCGLNAFINDCQALKQWKGRSDA